MADQADRLQRLCIAAAQLVDELGDLSARDRRCYEAGWKDAARLFFDHGVGVGRAQMEHEYNEAGAMLAAKVRAMANRPTWEEMKRRRTAPGGAIWEAENKRRGGKPYLGGPAEPW